MNDQGWNIYCISIFNNIYTTQMLDQVTLVLPGNYRVFSVRWIFWNGYISANLQYFFQLKKGPLSRHLNIFKTFEIIKIDKELRILWMFKVGSWFLERYKNVATFNYYRTLISLLWQCLPIKVREKLYIGKSIQIVF